MSQFRRIAPVLALIIAMASAGSPLAAQVEQQLWRWVDAQGSFCLWYLSDPELAPELVPAGTLLKTAVNTNDLEPVLQRIIQDEPRFEDWVPGVLCVGRFVAVASDGVPAGRMENGRPMLVTLSALAAEAPFGQEAGWFLVEIGLDAGHLDRVAQDALIGSNDAEFRVRRGLDGEEGQWELRLDGVRLAWQGRETGVSSVGTTRSMSFGYAGNRNSIWKIEMTTSPDSVVRQLGSLRIEGNAPLAEALKSSPIRAISTLHRGGDMVISFVREVQSNQ